MKETNAPLAWAIHKRARPLRGLHVCPRPRWVLWLLAAILLGACHRSTPRENGKQPSTPPAQARDGAAGSTEPPQRLALPFDFPADLEQTQWLRVLEVRTRAAGAWATGRFDEERNKLQIETHDVQRFSIDTERVAIDWNRLVILSIDGHNAELRRRESTLLHLSIDPHGRWQVEEPPAH